jgi:hypothetical protein
MPRHAAKTRVMRCTLTSMAAGNSRFHFGVRVSCYLHSRKSSYDSLRKFSNNLSFSLIYNRRECILANIL